MKFRVFISSVQSEFAEARAKLVKYIREDALLGRFFDPFIFEETPACDLSAQKVYLELLLRTHDSKSRNLMLAQALNWAGYVEQSGNGTESIIKRCQELNLATPQYLPDNADFKTIIWRKGYGAPVGAPVAPVGAPVGAPMGAPVENDGRFINLPTGKLGEILTWLWDSALSKGDIAAKMGVTKKTRTLKKAIDTLFSDNLIEYTIPEKPDHKQQRYQLSEKGREMLKSHLRPVAKTSC